MADINVQIKQRNGLIWDNLYPKTKAELVIESTSKRFVSDTEKSNWNNKQNALGFTPVNVADKNLANGWVGLDSNVKIPQQFLPNIAITETFVVSSQAQMLALTAQTGDVAIRTDLQKTFILASEPATTLANWKEMLSPTGKVESVNGKIGVVEITKEDVGLGNVTNESKTSLLNNTSLTGTPTAPTPVKGTNTNQLATTNFVQSAVAEKTKVTVSITEPVTPATSDLWLEIIE